MTAIEILDRIVEDKSHRPPGTKIVAFLPNEEYKEIKKFIKDISDTVPVTFIGSRPRRELHGIMYRHREREIHILNESKITY
jgi:hypothetical protein